MTPELGLMLFQPHGDAITGWDRRIVPGSGWTVWCRNLSQPGGRSSEQREWDSSLCFTPHPQFLSSVLWVKMRWEPQKTFFGVG